ncbi:MAG: valine--tRNA ligase [Planctomycetota bacterium]|jgi:valyl-tRNA synthetase|nr:valine--tRNA ligase [Planctomycetota bacterium]
MSEIELPKAYVATEHEGEVYQRWEQAGCFAAGAGHRDGKPSYTIMIPPPNVTGVLHMGHALNNTLQDTLIRWKRMQGCDVLWQPGTDHAGIATQSVVTKKLLEQGIRKEDISREQFLEHVWTHKAESGGTIFRQLRKLGSSCDWSRERFTMDEGLSKAVRENFVRLYQAGLIYQGTRMVNWDPVLQTALSDDEVEMHEQDGFMWKLRYQLAEGDGHIDVETTRPETFFGDSAVAVNPEDPRYQKLIGQQVLLPITGRAIPIIGDEHADPSKGTGAVKITPFHDPNDYEVGLRHELALVQCIGFDGVMNEQAAHFAGMDRYECRDALLTEFENGGVLQGATPIKHAVGHGDRSHVAIEPMVTKQWFVSMKPLAERALAETAEGRVTFHPSRWTKVYSRWLEDVRDWCISRQIWWGHRIPAWHCADCDHITVSMDDATVCAGCGSSAISQDGDVLDTWFSSALWPFSTLGWPEQDPALARYYPTSTLITDRGIIYFWVARMVMMGLFNMDSRPFDDVYIHGTVLDETGAKMSKSLRNGIDPLVMIEGGSMEFCPGGWRTPKDDKRIQSFDSPGYGADAVRYTLLDMTTEGQDLKLSPTRFEAGRNFANKVFNAGRFLLMNLAERPLAAPVSAADLAGAQLGFEERWILDRLQSAITECTTALERFRYSDYANGAYRFFRDDLCDWYLEWAKHQFKAGGAAADASALVLSYCFDQVLRLLHPGMPFLTEYLWQQLQTTVGGTPWAEGQYLMLASWPEVSPALQTAGAAEHMDTLQQVVAGIRLVRNELNIADKTRLSAVLERPAEAERVASFETALPFLCDRANCDLTIDALPDNEPGVARPVGDLSVFLPFSGDMREQLAGYVTKLEKELAAKEKSTAGKRGRLSNDKYVNGAPADKVQETRDMLAAEEAEIAKIKQTLAAFA